MSGRPIAHLVKGSGTFAGSARLGVFGNYPTFRTSTPNNGECADPTNPCMRMLLRKGLVASPGDVDFWDRWSRRERTDTRHLLPRNKDIWWNEADEVKQLHYDLASQSLALSNPLVVLAVGSPAQRWMCEFAKYSESLLIEDVRISVHFEEDCVKRVVVGCPHPETMFFSHSPMYGAMMDNAINLAVGLAGISTLPILEDYFSLKGQDMERRRKWDFRSERILPSRESRVITMARLRSFEKTHQVTLDMSHIPEAITQVYAYDMEVEHSITGLQATLKPGQSLCSAILLRYTARSHEIMGARQWPNLKKATVTQAATGWTSLKKAAENRMAKADDRRLRKGEKTKQRTQSICTVCSKAFLSRQGLWEHKKKVHDGLTFTCHFCSGTWSSRSGLAKHINKKHS